MGRARRGGGSPRGAGAVAAGSGPLTWRWRRRRRRRRPGCPGPAPPSLPPSLPPRGSRLVLPPRRPPRARLVLPGSGLRNARLKSLAPPPPRQRVPASGSDGPARRETRFVGLFAFGEATGPRGSALRKLLARGSVVKSKSGAIKEPGTEAVFPRVYTALGSLVSDEISMLSLSFLSVSLTPSLVWSQGLCV